MLVPLIIQKIPKRGTNSWLMRLLRCQIFNQLVNYHRILSPKGCYQRIRTLTRMAQRSCHLINCLIPIWQYCQRIKNIGLVQRHHHTYINLHRYRCNLHDRHTQFLVLPYWWGLALSNLLQVWWFLHPICQDDQALQQYTWWQQVFSHVLAMLFS